jgi:hypothetical protein
MSWIPMWRLWFGTDILQGPSTSICRPNLSCPPDYRGGTLKPVKYKGKFWRLPRVAALASNIAQRGGNGVRWLGWVVRSSLVVVGEALYCSEFRNVARLRLQYRPGMRCGTIWPSSSRRDDPHGVWSHVRTLVVYWPLVLPKIWLASFCRLCVTKVTL